MARSASMASATPGYCTLTATASSRCVVGSTATARWTWPIDAAAIGSGSHSRNSSLGRAPELPLDDLGRQLGRHRRGIGLQGGESLAHGFGKAVVEVAGHLADLHQGALHVTEAFGDLLGAAQPALVVELGAALGGGEQLAGRRGGVRRPDGRADAGQLDVAPGARRAADRSAGPAAVRRRRRPPPASTRPATSAAVRRLIAAARRRAMATSAQACSSTGTNRSGRATMASWPASTRQALAVVMPSKRWICRRTGTTGSAIVTTTAVGTSMSPSHSSDAERPDRAARLEDHPPVVVGGLLGRPRRPRAGLALQVQLRRQPAPRLRRSEAGEGGEPGETEEREALVAVGVEVRRRGRQHEPAHDGRGGGATAAGRRPRPSSSRRRSARRRRAHRPSPRHRRRSPRGGTGAGTGCRCPWPRWSNARTRWCSPRAA